MSCFAVSLANSSIFPLRLGAPSLLRRSQPRTLELRWRAVIQRRVQPFLVVDHLQKLSNARIRVSQIAVLAAVHFLVLQRLQERFADGVVPRIAGARHADADA